MSSMKIQALRTRHCAVTLALVAVFATGKFAGAYAKPYTEQVLSSFNGADGEYPMGGLVRDKAGNLFGTTSIGGANGIGTVFELTHSGTLHTLWTFTGGSDGSYPYAAPILVGGNLYGTAGFGGNNGSGAVYALDIKTGKLKTLHSFDGGDGAMPWAPLIRDSSGNLYGTTYNGGSGGGYGVVFELSAAGAYSVLYNFTGLNGDGEHPIAGLYRDSAGNLYGTTVYGGNTNCRDCGGGGTVFRLAPSGEETVLFKFPNATGPSQPWAPVTMDGSGNLYGATYDGGDGCGGSGCGNLFEITNAGNYVSLFEFPTDGLQGSNPEAGMIYRKGNLFGTTNGNAADEGTVFEFDVAKTKMHVLYAFPPIGGGDGARPGTGTIVRDKSGNLYGTTTYGGTGNCSGSCGTVYEVSPGGK